MKNLLALVFMYFLISSLIAQKGTPTSGVFLPENQDGWPLVLSARDSQILAAMPVLQMPPGYKNLTTLPYLVDNSAKPYMRPVFAQVALECGQASGIGMGFTYEINHARNTAANTTSTQYPTHFAWNFMNGGNNTGISFFDTWEVLKGFGTPNVNLYGGTPSFGGTGRWASGYDVYYNAMTNRIGSVNAIPVSNEEGLAVLKGWIHDHLGESNTGGVANFYASVPSVYTIPAGVPEAGKKIVTAYGYANHGLTIAGYNDSVRYDVNGDGQYTNNVDINSDMVVDMRDWEIGALKFANNYSGGPAWGDQGYAYMLYRTLALTYGSGGIWNNSVYVLKTRPVTSPLLTLKATVKHNSRNKVKIYAGMSLDTLAVVPDTTIEFPVFNYQGGDKYMQGGTTEADKTIELGLDLSEFLNILEPGQPARFFLLFKENDAANAYTGQINSYALVDYTSGSPVQINYPTSNIPIVENGVTRLGINRAPQFSQVDITTDTLLPGTVFENYACQLTASGGTSPYSWDFDQGYLETPSVSGFPLAGSTAVTFSNNNNGVTLQSLPFEFPFYGTLYNQVRIGVDGYLMFLPLPATYPYLTDNVLFFLKHESISPFYANLNINPASGHGVWYSSNADSVSIRWKTELYGVTSTEVNFMVCLFPDGTIKFHYGNMNYPVATTWFSGIFLGDGVHFSYASNSGKPAISSGTRLSFQPRSVPPDLTVSASGLVTGFPMNEYYPTPMFFKLTDASGLRKVEPVIFYTSGINNVVINGYSVVTPNDTIPAAGEVVQLYPHLMNMASSMSQAGTMTLSTNDPMVTLTDSTAQFTAINPGVAIPLPDGFVFSVSDLTPDGYVVHFFTTIVSLADTFHSHIYLTLRAPVLSVAGFSADDGVEVGIDPGDLAHIRVFLHNTGGAPAQGFYGYLFSSDPYCQVSPDSVPLASLAAGGGDSLEFTSLISTSVANGYLIPYSVNIFNPNGSLAAQFSLSINVGLVYEDFETGNFASHPWNFVGPTHWDVVSSNPFEGTFCARSGVITHNQSCAMEVEKTVIANGTISFRYKVSSENDPNGTNYDFLVFYVDGVEKARWDGDLPWTEATFAVVPGSHVFKWAYVKDYSVNYGSDCAWVDRILFPPCGQTITTFLGEVPSSRLTLYPNPFTDKLFLFSDQTTGDTNFLIYDVWGKLVKNLRPDSNGLEPGMWDGTGLDGKEVPSGVYVIRPTGYPQQASLKVVKIRN